MKIFLSHTFKDKPNVKQVAKYLESRGYSVWLDAWEMTAGDSLISKISEGIDSSDKLVVFLSRDSLESSWVEREVNGGIIMEIAKEKGLGSKFVIPVLFEACKVPFMLRDKIYANFSDKGFIEACEELIAGIEGKPTHRVLEPYSNAVTKIHSLGQNIDGRYESIVELTANLAPISGVSAKILTSGFSYVHKRIGPSGELGSPDVSAGSYSNPQYASDGKSYFISFSAPELKKGISLFLKFYCDNPVEVHAVEFKDGYGRDI
ncbi:toll/interleukin-1 receptor domain-containing protein [Pseudomonas amygdali]|uniref:toll/interleukin-1 receptor domain-containing protein n=1 Tax=Pseudomonas amygdali TaxID=47877 RepID=UPI000EFE4E30|nr:toll/interleukin-1 receptor domain-containing protein [Pseudomonas amygdali]